MLLGFIVTYILGCRTYQIKVIEYPNFEKTFEDFHYEEWSLKDNFARNIVNIKYFKILLFQFQNNVLANIEYKMRSNENAEKYFIVKLFDKNRNIINEHVFIVEFYKNQWEEDTSCFLLGEDTRVSSISLYFLDNIK